MLPTFLLLAAIWLPASAIYVTNSSSCADHCGGGSPTSDSDIICDDALYTTTKKGKKMKNCIACESRSTWSNKTSPKDNDIYWFLYNQQYTLQHCLWKDSKNTSALPYCGRYCNSLNGILDRTWDLNAEQYDYCQGNDALKQYAPDCAACLSSYNGSVVLGTFLSNLEANCESQPNTTELQSANRTRNFLFATAATPMPSKIPDTPSSSGISKGAIAGIVVGVVVACALAGILAWLFVRRRRKRTNRAESETPLTTQDPHGKDVKKYADKAPEQPPPLQELPPDTATSELPAVAKNQSPVELDGHNR